MSNSDSPFEFYMLKVICDNCGGSGWDGDHQQNWKCYTCRGTGWTEPEHVVRTVKQEAFCPTCGGRVLEVHKRVDPWTDKPHGPYDRRPRYRVCENCQVEVEPVWKDVS